MIILEISNNLIMPTDEEEKDEQAEYCTDKSSATNVSWKGKFNKLFLK